MKPQIFWPLMALAMFVSCSERTVSDNCTDFILSGEFRSSGSSVAAVTFQNGYEVLFHGGEMDGTYKSGSLSHVRNIYRSISQDGKWTSFEIYAVGKTIKVSISGIEVVSYTEPDNPYRENGTQLYGTGPVRIRQIEGRTAFRKLRFNGEAERLTSSPAAVDETTDPVIRFQQKDFPIIDYHVHLKGGLSPQMADSLQKHNGICYGVSPNVGDGGVGMMLSSNEEVYEYYDKMKDLPFIRAVQGEGRKWTRAISEEALGIFDCLYTDAMTIVDNSGRLVRLYRPEEVNLENMSEEEYMDMIVDQTVKILSNEPADIYANATYIPDAMQQDYDALWSDERIDRVLNVLEENGIALEINSRYRIPSEKIILKAKERGLKFTFGTNNMDPYFGKLEYSLEMAEKCGLSADDIWFPSMSTRRDRKTVIYNKFDDDNRTYLFNGDNLDSWVSICEDSTVFSIRNGLIAVKGKPFGYLRTADKYNDYTLHAEWRWVGKGTNSGIFQRVQDDDIVWPRGAECQLQAGRAGDVIGLAGTAIKEAPFNPNAKFQRKIRNHPETAIEFEDGQWNRAEIICKGEKMLVYINGNFENEVTLPFSEGYIALQSEGGELEFRNIYIY